MARRTPKLGERGAQGSSWIDRPHQLSKRARRALLDCLGQTSGRVVLAKVSHVLGLYPFAVQTLDNAPRPRDYVRACRGVRRDAERLDEGLRSLPPHIREAFLGYVELGQVARVLRELREAAADIERAWSFGHSSGRPKGIALGLVVERLRAVFQQHYRGPRGNSMKRGAVHSLTERQKRCAAFVKVALSDAHIPTGSVDRILRRRGARKNAKHDRALIVQMNHATKMIRDS